MSGSGAGGLPPIRRRGVASASGPGSGGRPTAGRNARSGSRSGVTGWDDSAGPPGASRGTSGGADRWGGPGISSGRLDRPSTALIAALATLAVVTLGLVVRGGPVELAIAILSGMFIGVVLLGLARLDANTKRSRGRFADWRFESVRVATLLFVLGWAAGLLSLWRFALVISRNFT